MTIDKETIYKVADLARIAIEEKEVDSLMGDMTQITHGSTLKKAAGRLPAEK